MVTSSNLTLQPPAAALATPTSGSISHDFYVDLIRNMALDDHVFVLAFLN